MQIKYENIILRDMIETDIEDYVRWFTAEREWEKWDAPWEKEDTDEEIERKEWTKYYESVKNRPDNAYRWKFEIEWNGKHIGWVSSYCIDENYEWVGKAEEGQIVHRAVGIDICESDSWGKGTAAGNGAGDTRAGQRKRHCAAVYFPLCAAKRHRKEAECQKDRQKGRNCC